MKFYFRFLAILIIGLITFVVSCTHDPVLPAVYQSNVPILVENCNPDSVYYNAEVVPILLSNCATSGCHDAATSADGVDLSSYTQVIKTGGIKPFNASNSELIEVLYESGEDQMPPPPSNHLPNDVIAILENWINQGAYNLACIDPAPCDSVNIGFSQYIAPIMSINCVGCHSGSTPQGGIDLSNYTRVKEQVDNGKLMGSIEGVTGFIAMPPGGYSLDSCKIAQLNIWVNDGVPNN